MMYYVCKCGNKGGANKFYTKEGTHVGLYCKKCNKWIKWLPQSEARMFNSESKLLDKSTPSLAANPADTTKTTESTTAALKASSIASEVIAINRSKISAFGITHNGDVFIDAAGIRYNVTRASILKGKSKQEMYDTIYKLTTSLVSGTILQFELSGSASRPGKVKLQKKKLFESPSAELTEKNTTIDDDELPWD